MRIKIFFWKDFIPLCMITLTKQFSTKEGYTIWNTEAYCEKVEYTLDFIGCIGNCLFLFVLFRGLFLFNTEYCKLITNHNSVCFEKWLNIEHKDSTACLLVQGLCFHQCTLFFAQCHRQWVYKAPLRIETLFKIHNYS
jgi:hypothetical protein